MSNHDYSAYKDFVKTIKDPIPLLPDMLQGRFRRVINNKTCSTPEEPKDGLVFEYMSRTKGMQVITPLVNMIECASCLYFVTHNLGPFCNRLDLSKQMRACINFFIMNKDSNTMQILNLKIKGNKSSTLGNIDSVPYYCASNNGQHSSQDAMSAGSKAQPTEASNKPLCGQEATPTAMPEVTQLTNHHLKVLSALNDKLRRDKKDLLNPKRVSVHAWQQQLCEKLLIILFACDILDRRMTTFTNTDSLLHSITMNSFSPQLQADYFSKRGDKLLKIIRAKGTTALGLRSSSFRTGVC